jgi:hypothetical protein
MTKSLLLLTLCLLAISPSALAQESNGNLLSCAEPFEAELLKKNAKPLERGAIAAETISQSGITVPSLWWTKEQFDTSKKTSGKLITNWLAYPKQKRIDLIVNWQMWTLLDAIQRYSLINNFATIAREYGYNLRFFNQQSDCLAVYRYNHYTSPPKWEIQLDPSLRDSLEIRNPPADEFKIQESGDRG